MIGQTTAETLYLVILDDGSLPSVGHLSDRDWQEVQSRLKSALAVP